MESEFSSILAEHDLDEEGTAAPGKAPTSTSSYTGLVDPRGVVRPGWYSQGSRPMEKRD